MSKLIAIDPGNKKCGLILADFNEGKVLEGRVVEHNIVLDLLSLWVLEHQVNKILLGNGTTSEHWNLLIRDLATVQLVDETGTTLLARKRYWELWPPSPLLRWLPRGLILPSENLDAIAALVLLETYIGKKFIWSGAKNFKILLSL